MAMIIALILRPFYGRASARSCTLRILIGRNEEQIEKNKQSVTEEKQKST